MAMTRRVVACAVAVAAALALPASTAAADAPAPTQGEILDLNAHPVFDWSVPSRYAASWSAWNPTTSTYDKNFVNPKGWSLDVNGCTSTSLYTVTSYTFTLEELGTTWKLTDTSGACSRHLRDLLPAQGTYAATLTLHTSIGNNSGVSVPLRKIVTIKDHLVVSMGDSMASGEGNPDLPGVYDVTYVEGVEYSVSTVTPAVWKDQRCHRSARSGPALAAKAIEDADPKTSVTFLSFACSGAELANLIDTRYRGIHPVGSTTVPAQVDAVADAVGPVDGRPARRIDALLVTAGVNDLHYSDIIKRCASNFGNSVGCVTSGGIAAQVESLPLKLANLAIAIKQKLPATREVYLSDYPTDPFHGGGCGSLGLSHVGISAAEASEMEVWGTALDNKISGSARMFRNAPYDENEVDLLAVPFVSHAYCSSAPWFQHYEQSWQTQGDETGTAHPNGAGAQAWADQIRRLVVLDQVDSPYRHLTVTVNALKLPAVTSTPTASVPVTLFEYQNDLVGLTRYSNVPRNGLWTPVSASQGTFFLDVFPSPSSPRHATALYMDVGHLLRIAGNLSNAYGAGHHVLVHPSGQLSVDYTVTVGAP